MRFGILGATTIFTDSGNSLTPSSKTAQVLALLLIRPRRVLPRTRLVRAVWGDEPPSSAETMLREHVKKIRCAIGCRDLLVSVAGGYRLDVDHGSVDAGAFEQFCGLAGQHLAAGQFDVGGARLQRALDLWRDEDALSDVRDVVELEAEAYRLQELRCHAQEQLIETYLASGRPAIAMPDLRVLTVRHPTRERFWSLLMAAQYLLGRSPEASLTYRSACRRYVDSVGINPSEDLHELHRAILDGAPKEFVVRAACTSAGARAGLDNGGWLGRRFSAHPF